MTADILPFRLAKATAALPAPDRRCVPGDIVVTCFNATIGLWCAWPVDTVDDDGIVVMVSDRNGRRIAVERVSCDLSFGLAAVDHDDLAFRALRWRTWPNWGAALTSFAEINAVAVRAR